MNLLVEADQPGNQLDYYISRLNSILSQKAAAIVQLQGRLAQFQRRLREHNVLASSDHWESRMHSLINQHVGRCVGKLVTDQVARYNCGWTLAMNQCDGFDSLFPNCQKVALNQEPIFLYLLIAIVYLPEENAADAIAYLMPLLWTSW